MPEPTRRFDPYLDFRFHGIPTMASDYMPTHVMVTEARTWRERLLSADSAGPWYQRPWTPWQGTRTVQRPGVYRTPFGIIGHPSILSRMVS